MLSDGRFWAGVAVAVVAYFAWRWYQQRKAAS